MYDFCSKITQQQNSQKLMSVLQGIGLFSLKVRTFYNKTTNLLFTGAAVRRFEQVC